MTDMVIRSMDFSFSEDMDLVFIKNDPATSFIFLGSWMLLPYLEPYLIRSVRKAIAVVQDERVKEDMRHFCAQEGNHFREHQKANAVIRSKAKFSEKLLALEKQVEEEYKQFTLNKPLKFNLAYAEGFESMTSASSSAQFETSYFDDMKSPIRELMEWHVMEEIEHRTVAFDAYHHTGGGYFYRLAIGVWAQWHFINRSLQFAKLLKDSFPDLVEQYNTPEDKKIRNARQLKLTRKSLPRILKTYMPWYSPRNLPLSRQFQDARSHYTEIAKTIR